MKQLTLNVPEDKLEEVMLFLSTIGIDHAIEFESPIPEWQQQKVLDRQKKFDPGNAIDINHVEMEMKRRYGIQRID